MLGYPRMVWRKVKLDPYIFIIMFLSVCFKVESYHVALSCLGFPRWNRLAFGTHRDMPAFTLHVPGLKVCTIRSKHVIDTLKITENGFCPK